MSEEELQQLRDELKKVRAQVASDRKLIARASQAMGEISRGPGLSDEHADVLAALRIRIEGKERAKLEDLLSAAGDLSGKPDLADVLDPGTSKSEWPTIEEKKPDWPGA